MTNAIRYGVIDGLSNAILLFLLGGLVASVFLYDSPIACVIASFIFAILSLLLFYILVRKLAQRVGIFFVVGFLTFLFTSLLLSYISIEFPIGIFPKGNLENVNGLVLLICLIIYIPLSEILRIVGCMCKSFNNAIKRKIN